MKRLLYISLMFIISFVALSSCNKDSEETSTDWSKIERMVVGSRWTTVIENEIYFYYEFLDKNSYRYYANLSLERVPFENGIVQASEDDFTYMATVNLSVKEFFTGKLLQIEGIQVSIIDNDTIRVYSPMQDVTVDLVRIKGFLN